MSVPFDMATEQEFFTINLNTTTGVDLHTSVITAHLRTIQGSTEMIQLYASALPSYNFNGANSTRLPLSSLASGGTLTIDLTPAVTTTAGTWDNTKVESLGFLISAAATPEPVQILVESITISNTTAVGPFLFTMSTDVNDSTTIDANYNVPNILFANNYNTVPGAKATWVPPSP